MEGLNGRACVVEDVKGWRRAEKGWQKKFPVTGFFWYIWWYASQKLRSKGGVLSRELPAYVRSGHLRVSRHLRTFVLWHLYTSHDYPYILTMLIWPVLFLYPNIFVLNTHSYAYVAFSITTCLVYCILIRANSVIIAL